MEGTYLKPSDYLNCQPWEKDMGERVVHKGGLVQLASDFLHKHSVRYVFYHGPLLTRSYMLEMNY